MEDDRISLACILGKGGGVLAHLAICRIREAVSFCEIPAEAIKDAPDGFWVFDPHGRPPMDASVQARPTVALWIAILQRAAKTERRHVMALADQWRLARSMRAGAPWRRYAPAGDRHVIAAIEVDPPMVTRLARQFEVPMPCAYRVDVQDLRAWGDLAGVEREFESLRRIMDTRAANQAARLG